MSGKWGGRCEIWAHHLSSSVEKPLCEPLSCPLQGQWGVFYMNKWPCLLSHLVSWTPVLRYGSCHSTGKLCFLIVRWRAQLSSGDGLGQHIWGHLPSGLLSWPRWHTPHLLPLAQIPAPLCSIICTDCTWCIRPTHLSFVKEGKRVWLCKCVPGHSETTRSNPS